MALIGEIVVTRAGDFWFADYPKHSDYDIQSQPLRVKDLRDAFAKHAAGVLIGCLG